MIKNSKLINSIKDVMLSRWALGIQTWKESMNYLQNFRNKYDRGSQNLNAGKKTGINMVYLHYPYNHQRSQHPLLHQTVCLQMVQDTSPHVGVLSSKTEIEKIWLEIFTHGERKRYCKTHACTLGCASFLSLTQNMQ